MQSPGKHKSLFLSLFCFVLSGCASDGQIIPKSEHTMDEIYNKQHLKNNNNISSDSPSRNGAGAKSVVTRPASVVESSMNPYLLHDTRKTDFQKLPNPTIYMFVAPKITKSDRIPVPAFITEYPLYERDEWAEFGELNLENYK